MRVLAGPNRGFRWLAGSTVHGCWIGTYEAEKARLFAAHVRPGMVVFDIGAHVGYYTLIAARAVGSMGCVFAFEPHSISFEFLQQHIRMNDLTNVRALSEAVSDGTGRARLLCSGHRSMARLVSAGGTEVDRVRLDDIDAPAPSVLKIDVEGSEDSVLTGAMGILTSARPTIFLATHGPAVHKRCLDLLGSLGYEWRTISGRADEIFAYPPESAP